MTPLPRNVRAATARNLGAKEKERERRVEEGERAVVMATPAYTKRFSEHVGGGAQRVDTGVVLLYACLPLARSRLIVIFGPRPTHPAAKKEEGEKRWLR